MFEDEDEVLISLEQKDKRVEKGKDNYTVGFTVLTVSYLKLNFVKAFFATVHLNNGIKKCFFGISYLDNVLYYIFLRYIFSNIKHNSKGSLSLHL